MDDDIRVCPKCKIYMGHDWLYHHQVERCMKCNGIFLDEGELGHLVRLMEIYKEINLKEKEIPTLDKQERYHYICPADKTEMSREDYGGLPVDICTKCHGVWLDDGELISLKKTEDHIKTHLDLYIRLAE